MALGAGETLFHAFPKFIRRAYSSLVNIPQPKSAGQVLLALTLCSSCAIDACAWSSASLLHPSIRQEERRGKSILPDILLGVVGAMAGGWLFYSFGPAGVNGLNLYSHFAAVIGSLVFLLTYYAMKPIKPR